jgi:hypothetical protein
MGIQGFFQFLNWLQHLTVSCTAVAQVQAPPSTLDHPETQTVVAYGGNCVQAFLYALQSHGALSWVLGS